MILYRRLIALGALILAKAAALPATATELHLPYAVASQVSEPAVFDSYNLPIGPWADKAFASEKIEGFVTRHAWRLDAPRASLLDIMAPLRSQILSLGYEVLYDCEARDCGGFDFRFATEVMAEPAMYVDLANYRFVSARNGNEVLSLMVSRSADIGYVQMIHVAPDEGSNRAKPAPQSLTQSPIAPIPTPPNGAFGARLEQGLSVPISGLLFPSNSRSLEGDKSDLVALAAWLKAHPERKLVLVGHSDISGSIAGNITVSAQRAEAVRQWLITQGGIASARLTAQGVGPLSPRAPHNDPANAMENRRVEALALP